MLEPRIPNVPKGSRAPFIGPIVEPLGGARVADSSSPTSLSAIASDLRALTAEQAYPVHTAVFAAGIMRSRFFAAAAWLYQWRTKCDHVTAWGAILYDRNDKRREKTLQTLTTGMLEHLWGGLDTEEFPRSIGGFSTRELQFIANVTYLASREPTE
jgi:hypothetical protein